MPGHSGRWWCQCCRSEQDATYCPYGKPGDRLWVRETHALKEVAPHGYAECLIHYQAGGEPLLCGPASDDMPRLPTEAERPVVMQPSRWRPSIHMPRWASRITLEIVSVRIERLQDITEVDAIAEGIERDAAEFKNYLHEHDEFPWLGGVGAAKLSYRSLWDSINGPGSWSDNPWVWVIEFKRVESEVAA